VTGTSHEGQSIPGRGDCRCIGTAARACLVGSGTTKIPVWLDGSDKARWTATGGKSFWTEEWWCLPSYCHHISQLLVGLRVTQPNMVLSAWNWPPNAYSGVTAVLACQYSVSSLRAVRALSQAAKSNCKIILVVISNSWPPTPKITPKGEKIHNLKSILSFGLPLLFYRRSKR
jgi:hypothetical protein